MNRLDRVYERGRDVTHALIDVARGDEPETVATPRGDFDNEGWLSAELDELRQKREDLEKVRTIGGGVDYTAEWPPEGLEP